jgi:hypothetical protein
MRKPLVWIVAGLFVLGLQGEALAQKEKIPPSTVPQDAQTSAPSAPAEKVKAQKKASKQTKKKANKKRAGKKKTRKAKKKSPIN